MSLKLGTTSIPGIRVVSEGSSSSTSDTGVMFIDYDGTVIEQWAPSEVAGKSALPSNPTHAGLTAQGWNWTLANIKTQMALSNKQMIVVGQQYVTTTGASEFDIEITSSDTLSFTLYFCVNGTAVIDWGDNSSTNTVTGTSLTTRKGTAHTYAAIGNYTIKISVSSGGMSFYSGTSGNNVISIGTSYPVGVLSIIKAVRIGSNVTSIGPYAFQYLVKSEYITLPKTLTDFGNYAFLNCRTIKTITIPETTTTIPERCFQYCYEMSNISLPYTIESIGDYAFYSCLSLTDITFPNSLTSINRYSFNQCRGIKKIYIPSSVTTFGDYVFMGCSKLKTAIISGSNISLGSSFFCNCYSLEEVSLPNSMVAIGASCFSGCAVLKTPFSISYDVGNSAFSSCFLLPSVSFSGSNLTLGTSIFTNDYTLTTVNLTGLTAIPDSMFSGCDGLTSVTIPNTVTSIGVSAFSTCYGLTSLTVPSSVTSIGSKAFSNAYSIKEYHFQSTTPPTLGGSDVFTGISSNCKIYVPSASLSAYQSATIWANQASKMVGE